MRCDKCNNEATVHEVMIRGGKKIERHLCEHHAREEGISPPSIKQTGGGSAGESGKPGNTGENPGVVGGGGAGGVGPLLSTFLAGLGPQGAGSAPTAGQSSSSSGGVGKANTPGQGGLVGPVLGPGVGGIPVSGQVGGGGIAGGSMDPRRGVPAVRALVCPACGFKYADFRQAGLLGCPECYSAFEAQLSPLLSRAHEGGTHHVGKVPWREGESLDPAVRAAGLASGMPSNVGGSGPGTEVSAAGAESSIERAKRQAKIVALREQLGEAVRCEQYEKAAALRDEIARLQAMGLAKATGAGGSGGTVGMSGGAGGMVAKKISSMPPPSPKSMPPKRLDKDGGEA